MTLESQEHLAQDLHESTHRIRNVLGEILAEPSRGARNVTSPQQISVLLSGLMRAGERLRDLPSKRDRKLEDEISAYRNEVERLRSCLPAIQASLLAERARLEHDRERLNGAAAWARASRQTLK